MMTIVYESNAGHTKRYADILSEKTGLKVVSVKEAAKNLAPGSDVILMGWVMACSVQGYQKASQLFNVKAVCGVCMGATGSQIDEIRQKMALPLSMPLFTVQGGFEMDKVHGFYKLMMKMMRSGFRKDINSKVNPSEEDLLNLKMLDEGLDLVDEKNLHVLLEWLQGR